MKRWIGLALLPLLGSCIIIKPPEKPVHLIVDVNVKIQVERELDEFFDFEEETPAPPEKTEKTTEPKTPAKTK